MYVGDITPAVVRAWYAAIIKTARDAAARQLARDRERTEHPVRVRARAQGRQAAATGKMPAAVRQAWREAGEPQPQRANLHTVVPLDRPGQRPPRKRIAYCRAVAEHVECGAGAVCVRRSARAEGGVGERSPRAGRDSA